MPFPPATAIPAYHLGILRGFLLGQDAPVEVFAAAEALYLVAAREPLPDVEQVNASGPAKIELPTIEQPFSKVAETMAEPASGDDSDGAEPAAAPEIHQQPVAEAAAPKTRKPWSAEAREAAANRMKAMRASGVIGGRSKSEARPEGTAPARPFVEVPITKLQTDHDEYAGRRDPGQELTEADWPDIRKMLEKQRRSVSQIASDYDVEFATMRQFIDRHSWDGKPAPGEGRAPSR